MAAAIMLLSRVICSSINCSRSSCKPNISPCTGCTLPVKASTSCSSVHCSRSTQLCQFLRIGLSAGQSMQNAQPTGPQQIADHNRQLNPHFFQQTLDLVLQSYSVPRELQLHAGHAPPDPLFAAGHKT